jgi:hypothetical protein
LSWSRGKPPLSVRAAQLQRELRADGIAFDDMRRASALELEFAGTGTVRASAPAGGIEPLEGPIRSRPVKPLTAADSRIRYFVDGAQRTLPYGRFGGVPVAVSVSAVGIIDRTAGGRCEIARGTLRMKHTWIVPRVPGNIEVADFEDRVRAMGFDVIDPLFGDPGASSADDYTWLMSKIYEAGMRARAHEEREALTGFWSAERHRESGDWILVDGRLHDPLPGALGLVKQFSNSYLSAADAGVLLDLEQGCRTTAFHPADRFRSGADPQRRTLWYLRMWEAAGQDARHALVRVEADESVCDTGQIDRISGWLLAERTPRAAGDDRWATLLYPVHQLERALKRMIDSETNGWPSR